MKKIFLLITILLFLVLSSSSYAASFDLKQPGGVPVTFHSGSNPEAEGLVEKIVTNVVVIFYTVGGIGVVIYFLWGSVDWILSGGDKEKVAAARKKMTNAIIGLVLLSLSYVIINAVGSVVGFNPLGAMQIPGLGYQGDRAIN